MTTAEEGTTAAPTTDAGICSIIMPNSITRVI